MLHPVATQLLAASALALTACGSSGGNAMQTAPLLSDIKSLQGMRARNLDYQLKQRGFTNVGGYKTD